MNLLSKARRRETRGLYDGDVLRFWNALMGFTSVAGEDFGEMVENVHLQNNVVSAAVAKRGLMMSQTRWAWRVRTRGSTNYRQLVGGPGLELLEQPDPVSRMSPATLNALAEYHDCYAGNAYVVDRGDHLEVLRPDRVDIVLMGVDDADKVLWQRAGRKSGLIYYPRGREHPDDAEPIPMDRVVHDYSEPHPLMWWMGQSWVTSVLSEVLVDRAAQRYLRSFFDQGASPSLIIKPHESLDPEQIERYKEVFAQKYEGSRNAFKTMWLGAGSDVTVVGSKLSELDLSSVQGGGETRIAMRSHLPAAILGVREGLQGSSMNAGNYAENRRQTADGWYVPTMQRKAWNFQFLTTLPNPGLELWWDPADVMFMQEDQKDAADIMATSATALQALDAAGYDGNAAVRAVRDNNLSALFGAHDGLQSVQRQPEETADGPESDSDE